MKNKAKILQIITSIYCLAYFGMFILPFFIIESRAEINPDRLEMLTVPLVFFIFLIGTIFSWFNEKIGGIILCIWHFIVWVFALFLWRETGMVLVLIFPMLFPAMLLVKNGLVKTNERYLPEQKQMKLALRILLLNYTPIYLLIVFANVVPNLLGWDLRTQVDDLVVWEISSQLALGLFVTFILFVTAFIISWKSEVIAGIFFVVWYFLVVVLTIKFPEFSNSGPWVAFGITILAQGILYIGFYFKNGQRLYMHPKYESKKMMEL
jgi:hypothetical protein